MEPADCEDRVVLDVSRRFSSLAHVPYIYHILVSMMSSKFMMLNRSIILNAVSICIKYF